MRSSSPLTNSDHRSRAGTVALVAVALSASLGVSCTKTSSTGTGQSATGARTGSTSAPAGIGGAVEFPLPDDPAARIKESGLPELSEEAFVVHEHAHLDVVINGQPVLVPANIGINGRSGISPMHTHDDSGIVHIEAEEPDNFTIGQLFTEWGVKLTSDCIATFCTDDANQLLAFVNGAPTPDPSAIPISQHAEIYVWYGPRGTTPTPPASYSFPEGL